MRFYIIYFIFILIQCVFECDDVLCTEVENGERMGGNDKVKDSSGLTVSQTMGEKCEHPTDWKSRHLTESEKMKDLWVSFLHKSHEMMERRDKSCLKRVSYKVSDKVFDELKETSISSVLLTCKDHHTCYVIETLVVMPNAQSFIHNPIENVLQNSLGLHSNKVRSITFLLSKFPSDETILSHQLGSTRSKVLPTCLSSLSKRLHLCSEALSKLFYGFLLVQTHTSPYLVFSTHLYLPYSITPYLLLII
jgi:hypothetical protein